jgi:hypothetical protein
MSTEPPSTSDSTWGSWFGPAPPSDVPVQSWADWTAKGVAGAADAVAAGAGHMASAVGMAGPAESEADSEAQKQTIKDMEKWTDANLFHFVLDLKPDWRTDSQMGKMDRKGLLFFAGEAAKDTSEASLSTGEKATLKKYQGEVTKEELERYVAVSRINRFLDRAPLRRGDSRHVPDGGVLASDELKKRSAATATNLGATPEQIAAVTSAETTEYQLRVLMKHLRALQYERSRGFIGSLSEEERTTFKAALNTPGQLEQLDEADLDGIVADLNATTGEHQVIAEISWGGDHGKGATTEERKRHLADLILYRTLLKYLPLRRQSPEWTFREFLAPSQLSLKVEMFEQDIDWTSIPEANREDTWLNALTAMWKTTMPTPSARDAMAAAGPTGNELNERFNRIITREAAIGGGKRRTKKRRTKKRRSKKARTRKRRTKKRKSKERTYRRRR